MKKKTLRLSLDDAVELPADDAVAETFALLAMRGAGKTNTARVMAEEMYDAGMPFVVIDPVGSWWGLRSSRDGKAGGLKIPIFGGKHQDFPLERESGIFVADLISEKRLSCVLDLSGFDSEEARKSWLLAFAKRLFLKNDAPVHLFLEEADDYLPQKPMGIEKELLRAWENIVRRGRSRGIGVTMITQRSAVINKNVLTQIGTLFAMRVTSPQDRGAVEDWVEYNDQSQEILKSLSTLEDGEAWVWSPHFLKKTVRARFRLSRTYDSGRTLKMSDGAKAPATLADIDAPAIKAAMAESIERTRETDPTELKTRIRTLEKERKDLQARLESATKAKPRPMMNHSHVERLAAAADKTEKGIGLLGKAVEAMRRFVTQISPTPEPTSSFVVKHAVQVRRPATPAEYGPPPRVPPGVLGPGICERRILSALATHGPCDLTKIALKSVYHPDGGSFLKALSTLRTAGRLRGGNSETMQLTEDGARLIHQGARVPLPEGEALLAAWSARFGKCERAILEALNKRERATLQQIASDAGYRPDGGSFLKALSTLRVACVLVGKNSEEMRIHPEILA